MRRSDDAEYHARDDGILVPSFPITHRDDEYDSAAFDVLLNMQRRHFWYLGRHRFLLHALRRALKRVPRHQPLSAVDLGGGCGGWVQYLQHHLPGAFSELALADSSLRALEMARPVVGDAVKRYQVDLLCSGWDNRWDVIFLLDVLEHIPSDQLVFDELLRMLRPGGILIVTTPALRFFWSQNDDIVHHVRRYSKADYRALAEASGFHVLMSRYFMFFLSPLLLLSRLKTRDLAKMTKQDVDQYLAQTHRVPSPLINRSLQTVFAMETPLGSWMPFPWGTSIMGIFQKPAT